MFRQSAALMPASFQKYHPSGGPAILPMAMKQDAGGLAKPRSQRATPMEEQFSFFPKACWLSRRSSLVLLS
jgi:hypothetical protein